MPIAITSLENDLKVIQHSYVSNTMQGLKAGHRASVQALGALCYPVSHETLNRSFTSICDSCQQRCQSGLPCSSALRSSKGPL